MVWQKNHKGLTVLQICKGRGFKWYKLKVEDLSDTLRKGWGALMILTLFLFYLSNVTNLNIFFAFFSQLSTHYIY